MSRHRDIRNLTADDYYDYEEDDYYDDDDYDDYDYGYTKEENEAYYRQQQQQQSKQQQPQPKQNAQLKKTNTHAPTQTPKPHSKEQTEKIQLVTSMGFSNEQAQLSLQKHSWDVQLAIDHLLTAAGGSNGGSNGGVDNESITQTTWKNTNDTIKSSNFPGLGKQPTSSTNAKQKNNSSTTIGKVGKMAPPPGWSKPKQSPSAKKSINILQQKQKPNVVISKGGKMPPPPGWGKPTTESIAGGNKNQQQQSKGTISKGGGKMTPPPGWGIPSEANSTDKNSALSETTKKTTNSTSITTTAASTTSPPKQIQKRTNKDMNINSGSVTTSATTATTSTKKNIVVKPKKKLSQQLQNEIKSQKSRLSMVILGHVDAGKSTLMGQVCVQMGIVQKRIVDKYQKQAAQIGKASFALAWVMDEDESERERGVTIDIATKYISTERHDLTILDAPGHADFVPAMITGAASADVGILVVAATPGEFESGFDDTCGSGAGGGGVKKGHVGQTREHVTLARGLGVSQLIVAINKLDAAEPNWSQDRFIEIKRRLVPFLKTSGFDMKRVQFVPISGLTGVNIKNGPNINDVSSTGLASWYKGGTLMEAINNFEPAKRNIEKPFRFLVSDIYTEGKYLVVKGRVVQGYISVGDGVVVLPICDAADVCRIEHGLASSSGSGRLNTAAAGDSVDLYLTGIDIARITVGNILSDMDEELRPQLKRKLTAKIIVMDRLAIPIIRGSQVLLHMHSLDVPAVISNLISQINRNDGTLKERPRMLSGGTTATVEIKLCQRVCLETFNECRALGRFALRRGGDTVAVGIVERLHC